MRVITAIVLVLGLAGSAQAAVQLLSTYTDSTTYTTSKVVATWSADAGDLFVLANACVNLQESTLAATSSDGGVVGASVNVVQGPSGDFAEVIYMSVLESGTFDLSLTLPGTFNAASLYHLHSPIAPLKFQRSEMKRAAADESFSFTFGLGSPTGVVVYGVGSGSVWTVPGSPAITITKNRSGKRFSGYALFSDANFTHAWVKHTGPGAIVGVEFVEEIIAVEGFPLVDEVLDFQPTDANLFPNGSFSMGLTSEPFYPGWRPTSKVLGDGVPASSPPLPAVVDDGAQANCLKYSFASEDETGILLFKFPYLGDTNQVYTLSFKARASRSGISFDPTVNEGGPSSNVGPDLSLGTAWQTYSVSIDNATLGAAPSFRLETKCASAGAYDVFVDEIMLVNDAWGISSYELDSVDVALTPSTRNGSHIHGTDYPLTWNAQGTYTNDVSVGLYLRDITRNGLLSLYDLGTINLSDGLVHSGAYPLANLKRGHYQAVVAVVDDQTRELLAVGREFFSVMTDLSGLTPPAFAVGVDRTFTTAGNRHDFNWRGFWGVEEYYQQNSQNGFRYQRIYYRLQALARQEGSYNWYLDHEINLAASNGWSTCVTMPEAPLALTVTAYDEILAADPADGDGYWWIQNATPLLDSERDGKMAWPSNLDSYEVLAPEPSLVVDVAEQCAQRYGDKISFIEYKNEADGWVTAQAMHDHIAQHFYPAYKAISPATKIFMNTTVDLDLNDPLDCYSRDFFELGGTNYSDGYTFHAYNSAGIMPTSYDLTAPEGEVETTGIERMAIYKARAEDYGLEFAQSECFQFYKQTDFTTSGWHYMQRVLLDVSNGALFSGSTFPMHMYAIETGYRSIYHNAGPSVPGTPCVALNGMHRILEGGSALGIIDKDPQLLIGKFQTQRTGLGTRYVAALVAGENNKIAELSIDLSGVADVKAYDLWGEEIAVPEAYGKLYVARETFYLETASPTALFAALEAATLEWRPAIGYVHTDLSIAEDEHLVYAQKAGPLAHVENLVSGAFMASRVDSVSSDYVADLTTLVLSGDPIVPTVEGIYVLDHSALPGSGSYTKMSTLSASTFSLSEQTVKMSCSGSDEATLFVNGQVVYAGAVSNLYYRTDWIEGVCSVPIGLSLVEVIVKPSAETSQVMLESQSVGVAPVSLAGTLSYAPVADTYVSVSGGQDVWNFGLNDTLLLKGTANYNRTVFLKFDTRDVLGTITNAVLRMYSETLDTEVKIRAVENTSWSETAITWNDAPFSDIVDVVLDTAVPASGSWFDLDLSSVITHAGIYSFVLEVSSTTDGAVYNITSNEGDANRPLLDLGVVVDLDGDTLPDAWEIGMIGHPSDSDGSIDTDLDGFIDLHEYLAGTEPGNAASLLELTEFSPSSTHGLMQVKWTSVSGKSYRVKTSPDLSGTNWVTRKTGVMGTGEILSEEVAEESGTAGFVRIELE